MVEGNWGTYGVGPWGSVRGSGQECGEKLMLLSHNTCQRLYIPENLNKSDTHSINENGFEQECEGSSNSNDPGLRYRDILYTFSINVLVEVVVANGFCGAKTE